MNEAYARAALAGEAERVQSAQEGTRNDTLHLAAFRLGQLVADDALPAQEVADTLEAAAHSAGLSELETRATIRSGMRAGARNPRAGGTGTELNVLGAGSTTAQRRTLDDWLALQAPVSGRDAAMSAPVNGELRAAPGVLDLTWPQRIRAASIPANKLDELPESSPLVASALYLDSIAWLYGAPATGKSFVALDIAGCVAAGVNWQGLPTTRGTVLYVAGEGATGMWKRVRAWQHSMGVEMTDVYVVRLAVQVAHETAWDALIDYAHEIGAVLIVIDTQARSTVGLEENSAKEMGRFVHAIERLREATRACVLVLHHSGRAGEHMRGSGALDGAATTVLKISRFETTLELECIKQKDAAEFPLVRLRMVEYEESIVISPEVYRGRSMKDSPAAAKMVQLWWMTFESDWTTVPMICEATGVARSVFYYHAKELEKQGFVVKSGDAPRARYRMVRPPTVQPVQSVAALSNVPVGSTRTDCPTVQPLYKGWTVGQYGPSTADPGQQNSDSEESS